MNNIFDTHAHYSEPAFSEDVDILLSELPNKGVKYVMLAAASVQSSFQNDALSKKYQYVYASAGVHPEDANVCPENYLETIENIIKSNPKMLAVGEIGLDYHYEGYNKEKQIKIFREQIALSKKLDLPVIIHSREATADTLEILKELQPKGVVHCFSGSAETAKEILKLGLYISFTGVLTFKNAKKALEALSVIPLDKLMLETDCPYMAPVPYRGKRCDSSMISFIAEKVAEVKGLSAQEILDITCENAIRFFGVPKQNS